MDTFRTIRIDQLKRKIVADFINGKFEKIIDEYLPGLLKLEAGEYFQFQPDGYEKVYTTCELPIDQILNPWGDLKFERLAYLQSLWRKNKGCIMKLVAHGSNIRTLGDIHFIQEKAKAISYKVSGIADLFILFDNCDIDDLREDIKKLELHYIDYTVSNVGKDNEFTTKRTVKNLSKIYNIINKSVILIALGITDESLIECDPIIEEHSERAYSPSTPTIEYGSKVLQRRLFDRAIELMIIFKSQNVGLAKNLFKFAD